MKNYKFLVPLGLIALFVISVYYYGNGKISVKKEYNSDLALAREYREMDIQVDAETYYKAALNLSASLDLYLEIGEFYSETDQDKNAISWGETIVSTYPLAAEGYEFLMQLYYDNSDYVACFDLYDSAGKREIQSESIESMISEIKYTYYYTGDFADVGIFSEGLCPVTAEEKWGYVNETGDKKISYLYEEAGYFSGSLAAVVDAEGDAYFIDTSGNKKWVVSGVEDVVRLGMMVSEVFPLYNGTDWSFYNKSNEFVAGGYEETSSLGNGVAAVMNQGEWTLIDSKGKSLTDQTYEDVVMDEKSVVYRNERLFVCQDDSYYMINSSGSVIGSESYEDAHVFNDETYAAVKIDGAWGFTDKDGNLVIEAQYKDARSFSNGLAAVKVDGAWGFIDKSGEIVIDPQFEDAKDFTSSGTVFVKVGSVWKLLCLYQYNH